VNRSNTRSRPGGPDARPVVVDGQLDDAAALGEGDAHGRPGVADGVAEHENPNLRCADGTFDTDSVGMCQGI
jgi:hypothetical protein